MTPNETIKRAREIAGWTTEEVVENIVSYIYLQDDDDDFYDYMMRAAGEDARGRD